MECLGIEMPAMPTPSFQKKTRNKSIERQPSDTAMVCHKHRCIVAKSGMKKVTSEHLRVKRHTSPARLKRFENWTPIVQLKPGRQRYFYGP